MKPFLVAILFAVTVSLIGAPPVKSPQKKLEDDEDIDTDTTNWLNQLEYKNYMSEVLKELENDKEFKKRMDNITDHSNITSVAHQLQFASHSVRTRLDEIKRREIARLNALEAKKASKESKEGEELHVDHGNPHTFEMADLSRLIKKVASDLSQVDKLQEDEFKEYEMAKELKQRKRLQGIKDKKLREEEMKKIEEAKERHRKHEKVNHPGSEEQLKEVWEKEDHMDRDAFDHRTFFNLHDKDGNGHLDEAEIEALMMGELDKVYDENNPDDDVMERYHEMVKMRQEMMREADSDGDRVITMNEFKEWTRKTDFKKDPEWKTTEEMDKPVYTKDELKEFNQKHKAQQDEYLEDFDAFENGNFDQVHHMKQMPNEQPHDPIEKIAEQNKHVGASDEKKEAKPQ